MSLLYSDILDQLVLLFSTLTGKEVKIRLHSKQTNGVGVIICFSVELACSVVTCSFSCLARFKQPSDGCVPVEMPLAPSELSELAGPELALLSL